MSGWLNRLYHVHLSRPRVSEFRQNSSVGVGGCRWVSVRVGESRVC